MKRKKGLSIILPIKIPSLSYIPHLQSSYQKILDDNKSIELIVIDESSTQIFNQIDKLIKNNRFIHMRLKRIKNMGLNDKMNQIEYGLSLATKENVLILDDDFVINSKNVAQIINSLKKNQAIICNLFYYKKNIASYFHQAAFLFENFFYKFYRHGYVPSHIAFKAYLFDKFGYIKNKNILFDDLAILEFFTKHNIPIKWEKDIFLKKLSQNFIKSFEQRIRYAYEYLAIPRVFLAFLLYYPIIFFFFLKSFLIGFIFLFSTLLFIWLISLLSYLKLGKKKYHVESIFFTPIWFWLSALFVWTTPFVYLCGGCKFGDNKIKKAI